MGIQVPFSNLLLAPLLKGYYVVSRYRMPKTKRGMGRGVSITCLESPKKTAFAEF
jgi:hypothetical protein